jgi:membrane protein required for colicin V production
MAVLDIALLLLIGYGAYRGFRNGLIIEVFTFLAIVVGIYAAVHFSDVMAKAFVDNLGEKYTATPAVTFTLTFLAVGALVYFGGIALEKAVRVVQLSAINRVLGAAFGVLKMLLILSVVFVTYEAYDPFGKVLSVEQREQSMLYGPVKAASVKTIPFLKNSRLYLEGKIWNETTETENEEPENTTE